MVAEAPLALRDSPVPGTSLASLFHLQWPTLAQTRTGYGCWGALYSVLVPGHQDQSLEQSDIRKPVSWQNSPTTTSLSASPFKNISLAHVCGARNQRTKINITKAEGWTQINSCYSIKGKTNQPPQKRSTFWNPLHESNTEVGQPCLSSTVWLCLHGAASSKNLF